MESFLRYLQDPTSPPPLQQELEALLEQYPWFTTARVVRSRVAGSIDPMLRMWLGRVDYPDLLLPLLGNALPDTMPKQKACAVTNRDTNEMSEQVVGEMVREEHEKKMDESTAEDSFAAIDHFLSLDHVRVSPSVDDLPDIESFANESVMEDPDLVSETLAEIYAAQGLYNKARDTYSKLSLLYPEKSVYFAELKEQVGKDSSPTN